MPLLLSEAIRAGFAAGQQQQQQQQQHHDVLTQSAAAVHICAGENLTPAPPVATPISGNVTVIRTTSSIVMCNSSIKMAEEDEIEVLGVFDSINERQKQAEATGSVLNCCSSEDDDYCIEPLPAVKVQPTERFLAEPPGFNLSDPCQSCNDVPPSNTPGLTGLDVVGWSWACSACTFVNNNSEPLCKMCRTMQPKKLNLRSSCQEQLQGVATTAAAVNVTTTTTTTTTTMINCNGGGVEKTGSIVGQVTPLLLLPPPLPSQSLSVPCSTPTPGGGKQRQETDTTEQVNGTKKQRVRPQPKVLGTAEKKKKKVAQGASASEAPGIMEGSHVEARWGDGQWYDAVVQSVSLVSKSRGLQYHVVYKEDGKAETLGAESVRSHPEVVDLT
jgi:hypothetical protein